MSLPSTFGSCYASHYDLFYKDKDYAGECDFLEAAFQRFASDPVRSVLDMGCGTGEHALILAQRGYQVTGVDWSGDMLNAARRKVQESQPTPQNPEFVWGDVRALDLGRVFDAVIMMFSVLGYQVSDKDLAATLATVRRHLALGGLFVADFWFGPAVLAQGPSDGLREWSEDGCRVLRLVHSELDTSRHLIHMYYRVLRLRGERIVAEAGEVHSMRYLFPQELAHFAAQASLEVAHLCPFLGLDGHLDGASWNVSTVMRAAWTGQGRMDPP